MQHQEAAVNLLPSTFSGLPSIDVSRQEAEPPPKFAAGLVINQLYDTGQRSDLTRHIRGYAHTVRSARICINRCTSRCNRNDGETRNTIHTNPSTHQLTSAPQSRSYIPLPRRPRLSLGDFGLLHYLNQRRLLSHIQRRCSELVSTRVFLLEVYRK